MYRLRRALVSAVLLMGALLVAPSVIAITTGPAQVMGFHAYQNYLRVYLDQSTYACKEGSESFIDIALAHPAAIYWKALLLTARTLKRPVVIVEQFCQPTSITLQ